MTSREPQSAALRMGVFGHRPNIEAPKPRATHRTVVVRIEGPRTVAYGHAPSMSMTPLAPGEREALIAAESLVASGAPGGGHTTESRMAAAGYVLVTRRQSLTSRQKAQILRWARTGR